MPRDVPHLWTGVEETFQSVSISVQRHFNDMFALRMGKKFNYDYYDKNGSVSGGMSFGAGMRLPFSTNRLTLDYAYQDMGYLESANRFSLSFRF